MGVCVCASVCVCVSMCHAPVCGSAVCLRAAIGESCRSFKELFVEIRERASKALGFAKMLRKVDDAQLTCTCMYMYWAGGLWCSGD